MLRGLKELIGRKCLEQILTHTKWNIRVAIVLLLCLKGFHVKTFGWSTRDRPGEKNIGKSCLG